VVGPRAGDNGRGIDVDAAGVYVAGGPSAEVRVFDASGTLLAVLPTGETGSFLNDVWVGSDGAAYVTDSSPAADLAGDTARRRLGHRAVARCQRHQHLHATAHRL
jgi:sugar lactone lactonase YvrE